MRIPVPGPRDVWQLLERSGDAVEQLLGAVPRLVSLLDDAERLVTRAGRLVDDIDATRVAADAVVARTDETVARADATLGSTGPVVRRSEELLAVLEPLNERLVTLLDALEPSLTRLQPVLERLAETTSPHEVDALVELIDHLPALARRMEVDIIPVLDSLSSVAPDLHDLLDVSRELNEMLAKIPGMGRVKDRVEKQQEAEGRG